MQLDFEVTQGDPFYREIPFEDQYGNVVNMTGWSVQVDLKTAFTDTQPLVSLTLGNGGLGFTNNDATAGVLYLAINADQFDSLDLSVIPRNGERVPFKFVVGDVKLTPPGGVEMIQGLGSRTTIFIKVLAGVTA